MILFKVKKYNIFNVALLYFFLVLQSAHATDFYVSLKGNDKNFGTKEFPFATLGGARDGIRAYRKRSLHLDKITIWIEGGTYYLSSPLLLTSDDSGTEASPVVYRNVQGDTVRVVGGRKVEGFLSAEGLASLKNISTSIRSKILYINLKDLNISDYGKAIPDGNLLELFYNHKPMTLARWPNKGFVKIVDVKGATHVQFHQYKGVKEGVFSYDGERPSRWQNEKQAYLHGYWFWDWADSYEKISSIDTLAKVIETSPPYHHYGYRNKQRYYALNLLSELDSPGEWYLDRVAAILYLYPPESNIDGLVEISILPHLLEFKNSSWVTFKGISFEVSRSTAITIDGGNSIKLSECVIKNSGSWGVEINNGGSHEISGCDISQTGEGGILVNAGDRKKLEPAGHNIVNNKIHDFGRIIRTYRPAVSIKGVGSRVAHNHIYNGPHSAILLAGNDHIIEYNDIHNVCYETGDVGAFYTGRDWTARGNVVRYNYFHDIKGPGLHGAMGVYLDDAASGFKIFGNIFQNIDRAIFVGGGRDNLIENNLFVDSDTSIYVDARGMGWMRDKVSSGGELQNYLHAMPYRKKIWAQRYPELKDILSENPGSPLGNKIDKNIIIGGEGISIEKDAVDFIYLNDNFVDKASVFKKMVSPDFQFNSASPVLGRGFQNIPFEKIGQH